MEERPHVETDMRVTGRVRLILTLNLGKRSFAGDPEKSGSSYQRYRQLRGTRELAASVRALPLFSHRFRRVSELERLQREGYEAGVFTQYLLDHELMPRYRLVEGVDSQGQIEGLELKLDPAARRLVLGDEEDEPIHAGRPSHVYSVRQRLLQRVEELGSRRLVAEWKEWPDKKIAWSRYGLLQIFLEKPLKKVPLSDVIELTTSQGRELGLKSLLGGVREGGVGDFQVQEEVGECAEELYRKIDEGDRILEAFTRWEVAAHVADLLLRAMGWKLECRMNGHRPIEFREDFRESLRWDRQAGRQSTPSRGLLYPLRFRYVVFDFDDVEIGGDGDGWQEAATLEPRHKRLLARLLSGSPVLEPSDGEAGAVAAGNLARPRGRAASAGEEEPTEARLSLPWTKLEMLESALSRDLASWSSEFCLFSGNNAVVCYPHPKPSSRELHLIKGLSYDDYWGTVVRCIEYGCELRTVAKLLEHETSDALEEAADCLFKIENGTRRENKKMLRQKVENLRQETVLASRTVARLRNVSMPTTIARTDYVMSKLEALNEVLALGPITRHVERNLSLIDHFLAHDESVMLQRKSTKLSLYLAVAALFVSFVALPTSLDALFEGGLRGFLGRARDLQMELFDLASLGLAGLLFGAVVLVALWIYRR